MLRFFVIICNYPEGMYVAAATWPCAYMFQAYSQRRDFCHPPNKNKTVNLSTFASSLIFPSALLFPGDAFIDWLINSFTNCTLSKPRPTQYMYKNLWHLVDPRPVFIRGWNRIRQNFPNQNPEISLHNKRHTYSITRSFGLKAPTEWSPSRSTTRRIFWSSSRRKRFSLRA